MNEQRYKTEHLENYIGILTNNDTPGKFKMELKVGDNPVLRRWTEKSESTIELEFKYNYGLSTPFFHDIHSCPLRRAGDESCPDCQNMSETYDEFVSNLEQLQLGDTFRIQAALINGKQSELPMSIPNFKAYEPLTVACEKYWLRLPDTPEGIKKKQEFVDQELEKEQDAETRREKERKKEKWRNFWMVLDGRFSKYPNIRNIAISVIVGIIIGVSSRIIFEVLKNMFFPEQQTPLK